MASGNWSAVATSSANASGTATKAADAAGKHYVQSYSVAIRGAAAGADITCLLKQGSTTLWTLVIAAGSPNGYTIEKDFGKYPVPGAVNAAITAVSSAGGASVITETCIHGYTDAP